MRMIVPPGALCCLILLLSTLCGATVIIPEPQRYEGTDRVSAAVAIDQNLFAVCARNDNLLRVYRKGTSVAPITTLDISEFLSIPEGLTDIRGATRQGDRIYWIGSHSRDHEGWLRPETYCFFATDIRRDQGNVTLVPVGKPCTTLLDKLPSNSIVRTLRLDKAIGPREAVPSLSPTRNGLSISALAADPRMNVLHIGFSSPRPLRVITGRPHALTLPLNNPADVVEKGKDPIFGEATLWDFNGLGITGLEYSQIHEKFIIVAQAHDHFHPCVVYHWSGMKANSPQRICQLDTLDEDTDIVTLGPWDAAALSLLIGPKDAHNKSFQSIWMQLPN
jgi:hypothetical protein